MVQKIESLANEFDAHNFPIGASRLRTLAGELRESGGPEDFPPQSPRLEQIKFVIEIPTVSEELYDRTREAVEQAGYNFIVPIRSVSIEDLLAEDRQHEERGESRRLGFVSNSKMMRTTVPPEMEVAINPTRLKIVGSNRLPTDEQKNKIKQEQARLREQVSADIKDLVSMEMVDPSTLSQLEDAYMDKEHGLLLPDWFARTDVQTVRGRVAHVGRLDPTRRRRVDGWFRDDGLDDVFGAAVVVLPRKLAA